jgi:NAD(P)-dependent dehydrogenase (short-subunit alcohol dehydrogenase family)
LGRVDGKSAIVSGGARGLGATTARILAEQGAHVVIAGGREEDGRQLQRTVTEMGGRALYVPCDVRSEADWERVVSAALDAVGKVDILVNNAGISSRLFSESHPDPLDPYVWRRIQEVNLDGCFLGCRAVIPAMLDGGGGSIVNIGSIAGLVGLVEVIPPYSAAKGGLRALTNALAVRYGPQGIRVNCVHPGIMPQMSSDPFMRESGSPLRSSVDLMGIPLRRTGNAEDVAFATLFLASDEAAYITGIDLTVDGGAVVQYSVHGRLSS